MEKTFVSVGHQQIGAVLILEVAYRRELLLRSVPRNELGSLHWEFSALHTISY